MIAACYSAGTRFEAGDLAARLGSVAIRRTDTKATGGSAFAAWSEPGTRRSAIASSASTTVAFDGWIANRDELRAALSVPANASDAQLYCQALVAWGDDADARIDGHYAAIAHAAGMVRLSRSALVAPPLHWRAHDGAILAASLLRCLEIPGLPPLGDYDMDLQAAVLAGDHSYAERGWYGACRRVPLGRTVTIDVESAFARTVWRYGGLLHTREAPDRPVEVVREHLERSVAAAMEGQAKVAVSLSGGLDSGLVAESALRQGNGTPLAAYCYAPEAGGATTLSGEWVTDESSAAQAFADFHGEAMTLEIVRSEGADFRASLDECLRIIRCAPREAAIAFQLDECLARAAEKGATVMLGGDEGNSTISASGNWAYRAWFGQLRWRKLWRELAARRSDNRPLWRRFAALVVRPMLRPRRTRKSIGRYAGSLGMAPAIVDRLNLRDSPWLTSQLSDHALIPTRAEQARLLDLADDLGRSDALKALEARHGLPYRDPTVTRRLAELCFSLPPSAFLHEGEKRHLARELARSRMPDGQRLCDRPELGAADARSRILRARPDLLRELTAMGDDSAIRAVLDTTGTAQRLKALDADSPLTLDEHVFCSVGLPAAIGAGRMIARSRGSNSL